MCVCVCVCERERERESVISVCLFRCEMSGFIGKGREEFVVSQYVSNDPVTQAEVPGSVLADVRQ